jgi:orotate phosphoribosyltransferase
MDQAEFDQKVEAFILEMHQFGLIRADVEGKHAGKFPVYFDLREHVALPRLKRLVAELIDHKLRDCGDYARITGVPTGGMNLAHAVGALYDESVTYYQDPKEHGTGAIMVGLNQPGQRVIVIEDVTSSAKSTEKHLTKIQPHCIVEDIVTVIDHELGGRQRIEGLGMRFHAIVTTHHALDILVRHGELRHSKRHKLLAT